jgi:hypothetical protein
MSSETNKEYSVKWKNHLTHIQKSFDYLLNSNELTDVTLHCEGKKIGAHKILLSACSTYFRDTFKDVPCQHPVIILYGVEYNVLSDILHFIYNGEVSVDTSKLDSFLKTAQLLQISGLTEDSGDRITSESEQPTDTQALDHETEQTSVEPVASSVNEDAKRGVKRPKVKEADTSRDKIVRQDSDTLFISDVKCEPSELVNFEDPLEDPLLQTEPPNEQKFYGTSAGQNTGEEEFKLERAFLESTTVLDADTKVKHSNFSEDCLKCPVCSKMFSHPYSLHHHKAVHSGNTQCPICHAVLSRQYNLKMHMKARHNL